MFIPLSQSQMAAQSEMAELFFDKIESETD